MLRLIWSWERESAMGDSWQSLEPSFAPLDLANVEYMCNIYLSDELRYNHLDERNYLLEEHAHSHRSPQQRRSHHKDGFTPPASSPSEPECSYVYEVS